MADLGTLVARVGLDTTPLSAGLAAATGELNAFSGSGGGALSKLSDIGRTAFLGLSAGAVVVGAASIKAASDFQASMELVRTQAGASQGEVDNMTKAILAMAGSLGTTPEQLAQGLFHIESAGYRGAQALDMLKIAAMGAKVGQADLESVTNALVAVEVSHIKGVGGVSDAMGILNAIVGVGNVRMGDLAKAMGTGILSTAANFGLSMQDVGGALATLTDNAVPADEAATRLRMTFSLMAAPSGRAIKALQEIGITQSQLADDMRTGGLIKAIGDLKTHLENSGKTATEQAAILSHAFGGGRTSSAILTLVSQFDRLKQKIGDVGAGAGTFADSWAATKETFKFQMDQMRASAEVLGIKIGTVLIPMVVSLVKALDSAVTWLGKHHDIAIALAAAIGGPLVLAMSVFVATEIAAIAPILAVYAAIGLFIGGVVLAYEKIGPFHDAVNAVGGALKDFATAAIPKVQQFLGNLVDQVGNAITAFKDAGISSNEFAQTIDNIFGNTGRLIPVIMGLGSAFQGLRDAVVAVVSGLIDQFSHFTAYMQSLAPQVGEAMSHIINVIKAQVALIAGIFQAVFTVIVGAWNLWGDQIMAIVRIVFDTVKIYVQTGVRIVRDIINAALALINGDWGQAWNALKDIPAAAFDLIKTLVGNALKIIGNLFVMAWKGIVAGAQAGLGLLIIFITSLPGLIVTGLGNLVTLLFTGGRELITGLFNGIQAMWSTVIGWATSLPGVIAGWFSSAGGWLVNAGSVILNGLWNGIQAAWGAVVSWFQALPGNFVSFFSSALSWLVSAGSAVIQGLANGIGVVWGAVAGWFQGLPGTIGGFFSSAISWLLDAGKAVIQGFADGIGVVWAAVTSWFGSLPGLIAGFAAGAATWLYNAGIDLIKGLLNGMIAAMDLLPGIVQRFLGLDAVIQGLHDAVNALDGAKVSIQANANTAQAQAAIDKLLATMNLLGGIPQGPPPPGTYLPPPGSPNPLPLPPGFAQGGLTTGMGIVHPNELVLPMTDLHRARALLSQYGGPIVGGPSGSTGPAPHSTTHQYNINGNIVASDPMELEKQLEARARISAMSGRAP